MPIFNPDTADPTIYNIYLDNLADVYAGAPLDGYILQWSDGSGAWLSVPFSSITGAPNSLDALTNVVITAETAGQVLAFDGLNWINSGTVVVASLDNLTDVQAASPTGLNVLAYSGGTWLNMPLRLEHLGNVLKSGEHGYPIDQDVLHYHGGYWQSGPLGLDHLTDVSTAGATINDVLLYNGTYWSPQEVTANSLNLNGIFAPTGLVFGTGANNAIAINNSLDSIGYCYIPSGTYYVTSHINMSRPRSKLFGPGTIKAGVGHFNSQVIYMSSSGCTVEDIVLDGETTPADVIGINVAGDHNTVRNVTISGIANNGISSAGFNTLIDACKLYYCGILNTSGVATAIVARGRNNTVQNTYVEGWGTQAIGLDCTQRTPSRAAYATVDKCYLRTGTGNLQQDYISVGILIDSGPNSSGYNGVRINDTVIHMERLGTGVGDGSDFNTPLFKAAIVDQLHITNCMFTASVTGDSMNEGIHIAEHVKQITIDNSLIGINIAYEANTNGTQCSDSFVCTNSQIGNVIHPYALAKVAFDDLRARYIKIDNCTVSNSGTTTVISTDYDLIDRLEITNNRIWGNTSSNLSILNWATGEIPAIGQEYNSRKIFYNNNQIANSGGGGLFTASGPNIRMLQTAKDVRGSWFTANTPLNPTGIPFIALTTFQKDDRITNTGTLTPGAVSEWVCTIGGKPGTWRPISQFFAEGQGLSNLNQSYLTGIYDVTYYGVTNTGANVTVEIKNFLNAVPDGARVRFPAGIYNITGTIFVDKKKDLCIDAQGAKFREPYGQIASGGSALCSGTFYFYYCTGITFNGGHMSGYGTHGAIMAITSGLFFSGYDNSAFSYFAGDDQGDRNVVPCLFNMEQCSRMTLNNWTVTNKYRFAFTYRCIDTEFHNNYFYGVLTGDLQRQSKELVQGPTGNFVYLGELHKICARQNYCLTIIKGRNVRINNFDTFGCGGLITCGSSSLGGGQGPAIPELVNIDNCYMYNSYDNHIYFSSANICTAKNCRGINDPAYSYAIGGMKGRGADIVFENCYVQHSYHGFGIEGLGGTNQDYWTNGVSPGWSSRGCKVINCTAVDIDAHGVFLDTNEDNTCFPRDVLIANNYFYNCGLSVYNRNPTGWQDGDGAETSVIQGPDTYRLRIIGNTIENTGAVGPNQAIFLGQQRLPTATWVTGCEIIDNIFLGSKQGIYLSYISDARIYNNYGERIGVYKAPYIEYSGYPALVVCDNVKDSRIYDNVLAPTGHAASVYVVPGSTFTNVRRRDNDGYEVIN